MLTRALRSFALALLVVCLAASSVVWAAAPAPQNQPPSLRHAFIVAGEPSAARAAPAATQVGAGVRLVVNTFDPDVVADGHCSLIEALLNANADSTVSPDCPAGSGPDTLVLRPGTYMLTQVYNDVEGADGLPAITSDITVRGHSATVTRSADPSTPAFRIFRVASGGTLTLRGLTISHGLANQGYGGGGLRNLGGTLRLFDCVVRDNRAETFPDNNIYTYGAGLYNGEGTLLVSHSTFEENVVLNGYTAGIYAIDSTTVVRQSAFVHNTATSGYDYLGGAVGLFNVAGSKASTMTIEDSVISDNAAIGNDLAGGGLGNAASAYVTATLRLVRSTVARNSASYGGGVWSTTAGWPEPHTVTITDRSTIADNVAAGQGSGYADGGAIENFAGTLTVANSTISDNTATGIVDAFGGGISNASYQDYPPALVRLINSTMANNSASGEGGGLSNYMFFPTDVVEAQFVNTLVAGNAAPSGSGCFGAGGLLTSLGHNLEDADTCNFSRPSDLVNANAALGPLQDNGGPTQTHALLPGSQAIDAANNAVCARAPINGIDQRGVSRPQGDGCDTGSFEVSD